MKKIILLATLLLAAVSADAQYKPGTFSVEIKAAFGASMLTKMPSFPENPPTEIMGRKMIFSSVGGLDLEYQAAKWLGFGAGLHYSRQGGKWENYKIDINGIPTEIKDPRLVLNYLLVPVQFRFYVYKGLALVSGVQFGFLVDADLSNRIEDNLSGREKRINTTIESKKDCKKFDLSIPVGITYEFKEHVTLGFRYDIGLTKVNNNPTPSGKDMKNSLFHLSLGYKFSI